MLGGRTAGRRRRLARIRRRGGARQHSGPVPRAVGWAAPVVFGVAAGVTVIGSALARRPRIVRLEPAWILVFVPFAVLYLVNAAAPEMSGDGSGYHLGEVRRYFDAGRMVAITTSMYAMFPQGMEMLFWVAYSFGRHSAAALTHLACLGVLTGAMVAYGRRFLSIWAGIGAALLVFLAPVVGVDASSAYVDIGLAMAGFVSFYALELWETDRRLSLVVAARLAAGFCFVVKYTGFVAGLYGIGFVLYKARAVRPVLVFALALAAISAPWVVRNWVRFENPVAPFYSGIFPNPYIRPQMEQEWRRSMRHFKGASVNWSTPVELTLRGGLLAGDARTGVSPRAARIGFVSPRPRASLADRRSPLGGAVVREHRHPVPAPGTAVRRADDGDDARTVETRAGNRSRDSGDRVLAGGPEALLRSL